MEKTASKTLTYSNIASLSANSLLNKKGGAL